MKALITGIKGFSGNHLKNYLVSKKIVCLGFKGDLRDKNNVFRQINKIRPSWIFHLASPVLRSDRLIDQTLIKNLETDLFGTVNLIEAAAKLKKKPKILITNTAAVYQPSLKPLKENSPLNPINSYGLSKMTQELISLQLAKSYKLKIIITRTFLLIGPGQKPGFVVNDLCHTIATGQTQIVLGNPNIRRDFTDVRDACRAYYLLITKGKPNEVYNVCSNKTFSITEIVNRLAALTGFKLIVKTKPTWRQNDPPVVCGDNCKIRKLGWQPQINLNQSLKDTLNYWRNV